MKVINRFFFVFALLAFIFSDVRAELRFDDYRYQKYTSEDSIVHKIRMEVDKSAFYVYLIAGWSDKVFDILDAIENGSSVIEKINEIEL